ncbi:hypothetical protein G6F57_019905 [Rhizopus arrhizus]|nr:hypothetical protein G6F57_019905 [Rhizopus arrhizus]
MTLPSRSEMSKRAISPFQRSGTNSIIAPSLFSSKLSKHLATTVDAEEQDVLRVEFEVQPRTAVRNHAGREQELAGAVRFAAVVFEEHARRTVQLRHDDTLGAVDDEGTRARHERNFAHVDFLFLHFFHGRLADFAVKQHQADLGSQGRGIGQATLLTFLDIEHRFAEHVAHELQARHTVVTNDRENRRERRLQTVGYAIGRGGIRLQES